MASERKRIGMKHAGPIAKSNGVLSVKEHNAVLFGRGKQILSFLVTLTPIVMVVSVK